MKNPPLLMALVLLGGWTMGLLTAGFLGEFDHGIEPEDLEYVESEQSVLLAPVRAWRRRTAALRELSTNPWNVGTNPELAAAAYTAQVAPWKAVSALGATILTSIMAAKTQKAFANI